MAMYNIDQYIQYCLDSCLNQDNVHPDEYEVIVVNDGSTDDSLSIAETFVKRFENVRIISQNNAGLSAARNTGLREATGEYIWFVDGDDAIASNAVSILLNQIELIGADAYLINHSTFKDTQIIFTPHFEVFPLLSGKQIHEQYMRILPVMAWVTIYRKEVLTANHLCFLPGIYHEDFEFSVRAHHRMDAIASINEALYYYRISRNGSIMNGLKTDDTKALLSMIEIINSFLSFFHNEKSPFARKVLGQCAIFFLRQYYSRRRDRKDKGYAVFIENKKLLYKLLWESRQKKQLFFLMFIIAMPKSFIPAIIRLVDATRIKPMRAER